MRDEYWPASSPPHVYGSSQNTQVNVWECTLAYSNIVLLTKLALSISLFIYVPPHLFCYRWYVESLQIPAILMIVNIIPNWLGIMSWSLLLLRMLLTLLKTLYEQNVFREGSGFLVALLIDSRPSEFLADSLLSSLVRRWFPSYILYPEVLDTFYILKWYGWSIVGLPCRVMPGGYSHPVIPHKPGCCWIVRVAWIPSVILSGQCPQFLGFVPANLWFWLVERSTYD